MTHALANAVTDLGDLAVLLPLSVVLAALLWGLESVAAALLFTGCWLGCLASMLALKVTLLACGVTLGVGMVSPSGHAAASAMLYSALAAMTGARATPRCRMALAGIAGCMVGAIAASRVVIGAHSTSEVVVGLTVGAAFAVCFVSRYRRMEHPRSNAMAFVIAPLLVLVVAYGGTANAESRIRAFAAAWRFSAWLCNDPRELTPSLTAK